MRVGIFSNAYRPVISGVVNSIDETRKGLLRRQHTPFVFAPEARNYKEEHAGVFRFPSLDLDPKVGFPFPIPFSPKISRLVDRMNLDLVHSHHPILVGQAAANFANRLSVPLVYTFHTQIEQYTHYVPFFSHQTVAERARLKVSRYLDHCDLIICPSPSIRQLIESYGSPTRVETVPNAIDLKKFLRSRQVFDLRQRLNLPPDALISLSAGRLAEEKGLPFLIKAFKALGTAPEHHLVFAGGGPIRPQLEDLVRELGLGERVHFLGALNYDLMPALYQAADLFVMCSTTEVKPLVVLEALASGLPILAVAACGTQDTLRDHHDGLLSPLDLGQFSRRWSDLLKHEPLRRQISENARNTAQGYSIESYLDRLCSLYEELAHSRPRRLQRRFGTA